MKTPIYDFVQKYVSSDPLRLHMPGHKGRGFEGLGRLDITEIEGADVLYDATGIIRQSEQNASRLFDTAATLYSTEGSSLCIRAMLFLARLLGGKSTKIAAGRNAHKTFITAAALLDIDVDWLYPTDQTEIISCNITANDLEEYLSAQSQKPTAVFVTSPDYLGNMLDISALSRVCKKHGVLLFCDNAHGAYLKFLPTDRHPITLGADVCCDSAHKTLPVLTGGAYLHISKNTDAFLAQNAQNALSVFASTSPSYLILQSLDLANGRIASGYKKELGDFVRDVKILKARLKEAGFELRGDEPLKITLVTKSFGYTGQQLASVLQERGIFCEFADPDFLVMMLTPEIKKEGPDKIADALRGVEKRPAISSSSPPLSHPERVMPLKDAVFSRSEKVDVSDALGRVLAHPSVNCPPAIPIRVCGERIDRSAIRLFEYYGISRITVVK